MTFATKHWEELCSPKRSVQEEDADVNLPWGCKHLHGLEHSFPELNQGVKCMARQ